jgi:dipeptidyl aminopeptidase/acylaminoacyl peptidase
VPTDPDRAARQLTSGSFNDASPVWSPDGRQVAFTSRRTGDTASQIYVIDADGGEARRLTQVPTGADSPQWFPDSSEVAFISSIWTDLDTWEQQGERLKQRAESRVTARVWDSAPISFWDRYLDDRQPHVFAVNTSSVAVRPITRGSGVAVEFRSPSAGDYAISPDGAEVAVVVETDTTGRQPDTDIFVVPANGGAARNVTPDSPGNDSSPDFSPDGRYLAWTANTIPTAPDRNRIHLLERNLAATQTAPPRVLVPDWDWSVSEFAWTPGSDGFLLVAEDRPTRRVFRLGLEDRVPQRLTGAGDFGGVQIGANGTIVANRESFSEPAALVRIDPQTGAATRLSRFNDALLANVTMGAVESVTYTGANGVPIQMWVIKPPGFDPNRRYPVMLLLHGGPHVGITDVWTYRWNAQVMAGWGYVVAWHNFHGSSGFGDAFADSINPDRTTLPYRDTIAAADWLAAQPWVDPGRMAAAGGSYGGYLATVLLGREHPFRTLVAHAPVYNNYTQLAADYATAPGRFAPYWEDRAMFEATSPHMRAGSFNTPTLVIHGQQDLRVPVNHGVELFQTLQVRGVPSRFIYYPNENHWILRRQNSLFWYDGVREWVDEYTSATSSPAPVTPPAASDRPSSPAPAGTRRQRNRQRPG